MCQRYLAAPALYRGRKFDLRLLVAVRRFWPRPEALAWRHVYCRAANRAYTCDAAALGDFQTHFTSMRQARGKRYSLLSYGLVLCLMKASNATPFALIRAALRRIL